MLQLVWRTTKKYFENPKQSIEGVKPEAILNYDETNLSDDPGRKKALCKRGMKYPERVMNSSKSSTSIMFCGTASGELLPPYTVYKAKHLYDTWVQGGPKGSRFNRSESGWFDNVCFQDFFFKTVLPYLQRIDGKKMLIGDNLSSHLTSEVIKACEDNNISFVFLPPHSTHICQPLDVAFFSPLKLHWRRILTEWKQSRAAAKTCAVPKDVFPSLLTKLLNAVSERASENLKSGFRKCGIFPFDPEEVLQRLPERMNMMSDANRIPNTEFERHVDNILIRSLKDLRQGDENQSRRRKKKIDVEPGASVCPRDLTDDDTTDDDISCTEQSSSSSSDQTTDEDQEERRLTGVRRATPEDIDIGTWILVRVSNRNRHRLFLCTVVEDDPNLIGDLSEDQYHVHFLKQYRNTVDSFTFGERPEASDIDFRDVVGIVDDPITDRRGVLKFNVDRNEW